MANAYSGDSVPQLVGDGDMSSNGYEESRSETADAASTGTLQSDQLAARRGDS